jgi:alpha-maltose-1-phosphate synthase
LLEGMACGLPAICTNITSLPELVEEGVTGFVVPPNEPSALRDKIDWIRRHPGYAAAMGAAARKRVVECFNWEMVVDRCLQAYGDVSETRNSVSNIEGLSSLPPS